MTIEADIERALLDRVAALAIVPALPVSMPGLVFTPPKDHRYLRVTFVPNVANRVLIDSDGPHQHLGLLQVSVHWTKGRAETEIRDVAGQVAAHFPCDMRLPINGAAVRITKRPDVRDMLVGDADVQIPVMIAWECWA